jgi:hypothetical protein
MDRVFYKETNRQPIIGGNKTIAEPSIGRDVMQAIHQIIEEYKNMNLTERLHLFLQYPSLRQIFTDIDIETDSCKTRVPAKK